MDWMLDRETIYKIAYSLSGRPYLLSLRGTDQICHVLHNSKKLKSIPLSSLPNKLEPVDFADRVRVFTDTIEAYAAALYTYKIIRSMIADLDLVILLEAGTIQVVLRNNGTWVMESIDPGLLWGVLTDLGIAPVSRSGLIPPNSRQYLHDLAYCLVTNFTKQRHLRWNNLSILVDDPGDLQEILQGNVKDLRIGVDRRDDQLILQASHEGHTVQKEIPTDDLDHASDLYWYRMVTDLVSSYGIERYLGKENNL